VDRLRRQLRARAWLTLAVALTLWAAGSLAVQGQLSELPGSLCVLGFCLLVGVVDRRPVPVVVVASVVIAVPALTHNLATVNGNAGFVSLWIATLVYSFILGSRVLLPVSCVGLVALIAGINVSGRPFNPVAEMLTIGPWLAGILLASRERASKELADRAEELEEERELFARESVRYERARIARELHDIVAHCVSLMVVQANAGERLAAIDPRRAAEAFASISDAANQADDEINRLVELLADSTTAAPSAGLRIVEELVSRAQASGLAISCQLSGDIDDLTDDGADAAYRLVQEGITNAMKHSPGAAMDIAVTAQPDGVQIRVVNGPASAARSGLETSGGGNGLAGMHERLAQCRGTLDAGKTSDGGWHLTGHIPRRAVGVRAAERSL
jgi:signal transduction histidine kinase